MVKIRLRRMGAKKAPYYRVVVADARSPRDGRCIEEIGTYNPLTNPATITIDGSCSLFQNHYFHQQNTLSYEHLRNDCRLLRNYLYLSLFIFQ